MLCCSNSDITADANLDVLETTYSLILKLSHFNTLHQMFMVLIAVPVWLKAGMTAFQSCVCNQSLINWDLSTIVYKAENVPFPKQYTTFGNDKTFVKFNN